MTGRGWGVFPISQPKIKEKHKHSPQNTHSLQLPRHSSPAFVHLNSPSHQSPVYQLLSQLINIRSRHLTVDHFRLLNDPPPPAGVNPLPPPTFTLHPTTSLSRQIGSLIISLFVGCDWRPWHGQVSLPAVSLLHLPYPRPNQWTWKCMNWQNIFDQCRLYKPNSLDG